MPALRYAGGRKYRKYRKYQSGYGSPDLGPGQRVRWPALDPGQRVRWQRGGVFWV
jgi:hypothetical protein